MKNKKKLKPNEVAVYLDGLPALALSMAFGDENFDIDFIINLNILYEKKIVNVSLLAWDDSFALASR